jgi:hypothetical protein
VGAPPPRRPDQLGLKALREIKARQARTQTATAIEIAIGTKNTTETPPGQASLLHAQQDSILTRITTEERLASETDQLERFRSQLA